MKITVVTPIHCEVDAKDGELLKPCLQYNKEIWKKAQYGSKRKVVTQYLVKGQGKKKYFLYGFKDRVTQYCKENDLLVAWCDDDWTVPCSDNPHLEGIQFRDYQKRLIGSALQKQRGVLKSPTGSGKTVIAMGIMSAIPQDCDILFLCHTLSLITQTVNKLKEYGFKDVGVIGGGRCEVKRITVSTIQSFHKLYHDLLDRFHVIFVDECHHVSTFSGMYAEVLGNMMAPMRIGLTATLPNSKESRLALEGYIGPVIEEFTMEEAQDKDILATPKVKLIKLPYSSKVNDLSRYSNKLDDDGNILIEGVVQKGIVENRSRSRAIIKTAKAHVEKNQSVLIIVNLVEHGNNIVRMAENIFDFDIHFVQGSTEGETRSEIQEALTSKDIKCVISTSVWKEGVDIPSLDVLINGAGGKSELATLQTIGRGMRKTDEKSEILIYDFFDPSHRYLISHFGERICLYMDMGWM